METVEEILALIVFGMVLGALVIALIQWLGVPEESFSVREFGREMCKYFLAGLAVFAIVVSLWAMWVAGVAVWVIPVFVLGCVVFIAILWPKPAKTTVTINETKKVARKKRVKPAPAPMEPAPASAVPAAASQEETAHEAKG